MNNLIRDKIVMVNDEIFEIDIIFGGDYKVYIVHSTMMFTAHDNNSSYY